MKRRKAKGPGIALPAVIGTLLLFAACSAKTTGTSIIEQGEYLVMVGGCGDCHSPKVMAAAGPAPDAKKILSGYPSDTRLPEIPRGIIGPAQWGAITTNDMTAWAGPWGVSFSYNLTPDPATGIGNWDEALFIQMLRTGKFMGTSRDMLPPMPWQTIGKMTDDDLAAIFAYLKSLPPVVNAIPAPLPPVQQ